MLACSETESEMLIKKELNSIIGVNSDEATDIKKMEIIELAKRVRDEISVTISWDLKSSESFLEMEKYSYQILSNIIEILEDKELSADYKWVIIYSIQDVEFKYLKYILRDIAISFRDGKIDEELVIHCFFPDGWNYNVIQNYKDPIIREALKACLKSNIISTDFKDGIKSVLRGTAWREIKKYYQL